MNKECNIKKNTHTQSHSNTEVKISLNFNILLNFCLFPEQILDSPCILPPWSPQEVWGLRSVVYSWIQLSSRSGATVWQTFWPKSQTQKWYVSLILLCHIPNTCCRLFGRDTHFSSFSVFFLKQELVLNTAYQCGLVTQVSQGLDTCFWKCQSLTIKRIRRSKR